MNQLTEQEIRNIVRSEMNLFFAEIAGVKAQPNGCVSIKNAVALLGYSTYIQLWEDINRGLLRLGVEVEDRRRPGSERARYYVNIEAAKKRLAELPEKRR